MRKKSTELKRLTGTYNTTRESRRGSLTYPQVDADDVKAPRHLSKHAKTLWQKVAPLLASQSVLMTVDLELLEAYCEAYAGYRDSMEHIKQHGRLLIARAETKTGFSEKVYRNPACEEARKYVATMRDCSGKFGFSPYDRERIAGSLGKEQEETDDPLDRFLSDKSYSPVSVSPVFHATQEEIDEAARWDAMTDEEKDAEIANS